MKVKINLSFPIVVCKKGHEEVLKLRNKEDHFHHYHTYDFKCPTCGGSVEILKGTQCIVKEIICE